MCPTISRNSLYCPTPPETRVNKRLPRMIQRDAFTQRFLSWAMQSDTADRAANLGDVSGSRLLPQVTAASNAGTNIARS
jgi:hypothetical protein